MSNIDTIRTLVDAVSHAAMSFAQNSDTHNSRRLTEAKRRLLDEITGATQQAAQAQFRALIFAAPKSEPTTSGRGAWGFDEIARAAIKYLNDNHNPHTTLIVTPTSAEVVEGVKAMQTTEFVKA